MPELPEVETIVRGLARKIVGKTIERAEVRLAENRRRAAGVRFARAVAGERIAGVRRRGKYAVIELASGRSLVTSLRMTGRLVVGDGRSAGTARNARRPALRGRRLACGFPTSGPSAGCAS